MNALKKQDVIVILLPLDSRLEETKSFDRETSSALTDKQKSLLTLVRFSQRLSQDLTPQPLIELRWPISSGVCNKKLPLLSIFWKIMTVSPGYTMEMQRHMAARPTRMSSGSRLCSLHADVMLLLRYDPERPMSSSSS